MTQTQSTEQGARTPADGVPDETAELDRIYSDAQVSPWTRREKIGRALWIIVQGSVFRYSWHNAYRWRAFLLRLFGARVGRHCVIRPTARIEIPWNLTLGDYSSLGEFAIIYALGPITIGRRVTISQCAHLCSGTHEFDQRDIPLVRTEITIKDDVWVATDAFVGPGVSVGEGAILGARSSAFRDLEPWTIYGGSPARPLRQYSGSVRRS